jgi:hypothetical protein
MGRVGTHNLTRMGLKAGFLCHGLTQNPLGWVRPHAGWPKPNPRPVYFYMLFQEIKWGDLTFLTRLFKKFILLPYIMRIIAV